ncbi:MULTISPECIES: HK97-gp10 family putative phage morphogenesis protein [Rhodopseudomonas]|uniref:Phage protein, HK97 gp10 family n=1 Tax=Rhodopseudomonas palustris TaxID=1076 RepID=A0A0D7ERB7_RHOPL|nr:MULTISPECIES: HK97-gp10 family putative phage morphogenesis protein [Rhodopseudomonas]KIZ43105.1 hypothetical protein OO17_11915 [Rhodopseudomonas palustris]MDF3810690.1 hypothetical protein [Rhodopseudomonas sp. BAL398]WOK18480.1 hypothetical protein RBJ75_02825 [Rhodopseudomonas sp. BAL398]
MTDDQELQNYLSGLSDKIRAPLADAIREQAELLSQAQQDALKQLEQPPEETGDLVRSCVVVSGPSDLELSVQVGGDATTNNGYDRALSFEYGTSHQPARSFFYSTYQARRDDMQDAINEALKEALNNV